MDTGDPKVAGLWLLLTLIALAGLLGVVVIMLLMRAWTRYDRRLRYGDEPTEPADIWSISGQRLTDKLDQETPPPGEPPDSPDTPDSPELPRE